VTGSGPAALLLWLLLFVGPSLLVSLLLRFD
jgi:hypothetical protein